MHFTIFLLVTSIQTWNIAFGTRDIYNLPENISFSGILAFGDSMLDTGNNNHLPLTPVKSNFYPYGINLILGKSPSGRFSNGKMLPDLLAQNLNIGSGIVLPYLSPAITPENLNNGLLSFASAGTGYDALTTSYSSSISLVDQITNLEEFTNKLFRLLGNNNVTLSIFYHKALVLVSAGVDDIINYFPTTENSPPSPRSIQYKFDDYTDLLAETSFNFVKNLFDKGIRRIGVLGVPPIGCFPAYRLSKNCNGDMNSAATLLNSKLSRKLADLGAEKELSSAQIVFMDIYKDYMEIIQNQDTYGFDVISKACCGIGNLDTPYLCKKVNATLCDVNKLQYLFWDGHHLTESGYGLLALKFFKKYLLKFTKPQYL
ncbi:GDSL esterase/lipase At5g42170-like [Mercurialis annua]|uniref:GDSL esterase/lipase At5g42170-like n=1 Tax=Mercurialis annua TaxID=3986 RepID=UPI00216095F7|nr:GDSL esterase/lipase At5g42170-like [Mercurialis annua]